MIVIVLLGLLLVVAAIVVGVAGVVSNHGGAHGLGHPFTVFGSHVNGSSGDIFLYGIIVGVVGVIGLGLLWWAVTWISRRGTQARRDLRRWRRTARRPHGIEEPAPGLAAGPPLAATTAGRGPAEAAATPDPTAAGLRGDGHQSGETRPPQPPY